MQSTGTELSPVGTDLPFLCSQFLTSNTIPHQKPSLQRQSWFSLQLKHSPGVLLQLVKQIPVFSFPLQCAPT